MPLLLSFHCLSLVPQTHNGKERQSDRSKLRRFLNAAPCLQTQLRHRMDMILDFSSAQSFVPSYLFCLCFRVVRATFTQGGSLIPPNTFSTFIARRFIQNLSSTIGHGNAFSYRYVQKPVNNELCWYDVLTTNL